MLLNIKILFIVSGKIDAYKTAQLLKNNGSISEDVILLFDEIYIQQCEEYVAGECFGAAEDSQLYKGVVCFMVVGLRKNVSYVLHMVPETRISGELLQNEIVKCIQILQDLEFNVRGVCCDNHSSNVAAYKGLSKLYSCDFDNDLKIWVNEKPIYLFYDAVHLIKNIRNNLLTRKRFLFPPFTSEEMETHVYVAGGEISWSLLHRVHEEDSKCQGNVRAAPKLTKQVLHPAKMKQSVPTALAIFDPTTRAALLRYFPQDEDSASFLELFHTWWTITNSKKRFNSSHRLGNAAVPGDGKPAFLRKFANWIEEWSSQNISNSENFTLSAQTSAAMIRTLRCHASLIEDLLSDGFDFVLTSRFQTDPLEKRYGQYRQMSGGRFLISAKDVFRSEKILKIQTLVKEGFNIDSSVKVYENQHEVKVRNLVREVENDLQYVETMTLSQASREVSDNVAGYIVHKAKDLLGECCIENLKAETASSSTEYIGILSRGGLITPSMAFGDIVAQSFAVLDACSTAIKESNLPSRTAGLAILHEFVDAKDLVCKRHEETFTVRMMKVVCNCFFAGQTKRSNEKLTEDHVAALKRSKRQKV